MRVVRMIVDASVLSVDGLRVGEAVKFFVGDAVLGFSTGTGERSCEREHLCGEGSFCAGARSGDGCDRFLTGDSSGFLAGVCSLGRRSGEGCEGLRTGASSGFFTGDFSTG